MFWHNILKCKHTHTHTHTERQFASVCVCIYCAFVVADIYLLSLGTMQHSIEHWITFPWSALRCAARSAEKFSAAALGESFFLILFYFFCYFRWQRQRVQQARRHFWPNCVWNWIAIVNNSFPKIFPELPSKLIESTSGAKWDLSCKSLVCAMRL